MNNLLTLEKAVEAIKFPGTKMCNIKWSPNDFIEMHKDGHIYDDGGNRLLLGADVPEDGWYDISTQVGYEIHLKPVIMFSAPGLSKLTLLSLAEDYTGGDCITDADVEIDSIGLK
jgi:hypothetical protein